jgi:hypothetical protein
LVVVIKYAMPTREEIDQEQKKLNRMRFLVDFTSALLRQGNLSMPEMIRLIAATRNNVLLLFPDKAETYDLIIKPRFERIIREVLHTN